MSDAVLANFTSSEGTVSGEVTVTFPHRVRRVTVTNDSSSKNLAFKFNAGEDYATLQPTETMSMDFHAKRVYLSGAGVEYRVWGAG